MIYASQDPASPRLRAILDKCNSAVTEDILPVQISIYNVESLMHCIGGSPEQVLEQANYLLEHGGGERAVHPNGAVEHMIVPTGRPHKEPKLSAIQKKVLGAPLAIPLQDAEEAKIEKEINWIIDFLHVDEMEAMLPGLSDVPENVQLQLIKQTLSEAGKSESLAGARRALAKLDLWLISVIGKHHHFNVREAHVAWFFMETNASSSVRAGLVFAQINYHLKIRVQECKAASRKRVSVARGPAASSNVRQLHGFSWVACNTSLSRCTRYIAGVKVCRMLASLRGCDSRRAHLEEVFQNHFVGVSYDRKGSRKTRKSMAWGCPIYSINGEGYAEVLLADWEGHSSMCLKPLDSKGMNFIHCNEMTGDIASNTNYVKWFRYIAITFLGFTEEEANRIMSHGDRHVVPNFARILDFSSASSLEIGRWSDPKDMFLLYSNEVKFLRVLSLIKKILVFAADRVSFAESKDFPAFGGWEHYFPDASGLHAGVDVVTYDEEDESELSDDFDTQSSSDSESEEEDFEQLPSLPVDWRVVNRSTQSGRTYKLYYSPCGHRERSLKQAINYASREAGAVESSDDSADEDPPLLPLLTLNADFVPDLYILDVPDVAPSNISSPHSARPDPVPEISPSRSNSPIPEEEVCMEHPDCTLMAGHHGLHNIPRGERVSRSLSRQSSSN